MANNELATLLPKIKEHIHILLPEVDSMFPEGAIDFVADITYTIAKGDGLTGDKLIAGMALLILDLLMPSCDESNRSARSIEGVSESYDTSKNTTSKWKRLYDMLISGEYETNIKLHYVGIDG